MLEIPDLLCIFLQSRSSDYIDSVGKTANRRFSQGTRSDAGTRVSPHMNDFAQGLAGVGPNRVKWIEMPQVVDTGLATNMSSIEKSHQEVGGINAHQIID
ncbi:unnamed protein product [Protopolystoma xenopodis]|uniref:Uncharacterized protein n=1 Tax=Protopolystoma xenopodis TaxID=117903 RepID=A0A3S5C019_9PLAT|nr:unnamed protein product [Protopolystoma xenopodis]